MHDVALNHLDLFVLRGLPGMSLSPNWVVCADGAGVVDAVGDAVQTLAPALAAHSLLLVLSYRSEELRARPAAWSELQALDRALAPLQLTLSGLAPGECLELARSLGVVLDEAAAASLQRSTQGNPLFVRETLAQPERSPASYQSLLDQRRRRLSEREVAALEAAAVLGREFAHGTWQAMAGPDVLEAISTLIGQRFIAESVSGYSFQHDLTREHIYRATAAARRQELHRLAGEALQREHAEPERQHSHPLDEYAHEPVERDLDHHTAHQRRNRRRRQRVGAREPDVERHHSRLRSHPDQRRQGDRNL